MALLELIRRGAVRVWQEERQGPILLGRGDRFAAHNQNPDVADDGEGAQGAVADSAADENSEAGSAANRTARYVVEEERLKAILESLLFAAAEPVALSQLVSAIESVPREEIKGARRNGGCLRIGRARHRA